MPIEKGLIHVYTGYGKGKTSAAFGLALRALGRGFRVLVVQFLKGGGELSGESASLEKLPRSEVVCFPDQRHPIFCKDGECDVERLKKSIRDGFRLAVKKLGTGEYDLVVLDEINNCMKESWLGADEVAAFLKEKPSGVEVVLTGRGCPEEIIDAADYVTEMRLIKHPAEKGVKARKGVEY